MIEKRDTGLLPEAEIYTRSEGTTPYEMAKLDQKFPVARILGAAELVGKGPQHQDELVQLLADSDSAVRYWAAVGLLAMGSQAKPSEAVLLKASADSSPCVRIAAAEALCAIGQETKALPVLIAALHHDDGWVRFQAAVVLGKIGPRSPAGPVRHEGHLGRRIKAPSRTVPAMGPGAGRVGVGVVVSSEL